MYRIPNDPVEHFIASDATKSQFGYIINGNSAFAGIFNQELSINVAETIAEMLVHLAQNMESENSSSVIAVDNTGTIGCQKKNRFKYKNLKLLENLFLSDELRRIRNSFETRVYPTYINMQQNPADAMPRRRSEEYRHGKTKVQDTAYNIKK